MSLQPVSFKRGRQALPRLSEPYVPGRRSKRFWTDDEIAIVRKYYPAGGTVACLAHLGPHRTPSSIYGLANKLGLKAPFGTASDKTTQKRATIEAPANFDDLVREFYQNGDGELVRLLTTEGGSRGPDRSGWTVAEDNIIKGGYARRLTLARLIDELEASGFKRRSAAGVSSRAKFLGCLSSRASEEWSEREDAILKEAYAAEIRIADIVGMLESEGFSRTRGAIQMRAIWLRISTDRVNYWTDKEKEIALAGLRAGKVHREVLQDLRDAGFERGDTALFKFAKKHNIVRPREPEWTEAEYALLRQRYVELVPVKDIAAELGRKLQAVRSKASNLGLKQRIGWTPAEYEQLRAASERGDSLVDTAAALGRSYVNVARQAATLKLSFKANRPTTERNPT